MLNNSRKIVAIAIICSGSISGNFDLRVISAKMSAQFECEIRNKLNVRPTEEK